MRLLKILITCQIALVSLGSVFADPPRLVELKLDETLQSELKSEIAFVGRVIRVNDLLRVRMAAWDVSWLKVNLKLDVARTIEGVLTIDGAKCSMQSVVRSKIRQAILSELSSALEPTELALLVRQSKLRSQFEIDVWMDTLICILDHHLYLSNDQIERITHVFKDHASPHEPLAYYMIDWQFLPALPSEKILPILNDTQKSIYKNVPKLDYWLASRGSTP